MQLSLEQMQKCIKELATIITSSQTSKNGPYEEEIREEPSPAGSSLMECAQIPFCQFCGEKWDKDHEQRCSVQGKLHAIFVA